tara:strand:- start:3054 stop:5078 length:2025 start_codon:yes stop_codon:yes gene_type:complete
MSYTQISSSSGLISVGNTSARLSDSRLVYPQILESLNEFRRTNINWDVPSQERFAIFLGENDVFNISTDTVVGSAKDARAKTGFLSDLGLTNSNRILSDVGRELLRLNSKNKIEINEFDLSEDSFIYLKQLLKYQQPGFQIKPILSLIYSIIDFDNNLPIDFLTFIWPSSTTKEGLVQSLAEYKDTRDIKQVLYKNCLTNGSVVITRENCDSFFNENNIGDEDEFNDLMYSILPHGKGNSFKNKTISLFRDFHMYWLNKNTWTSAQKQAYIQEHLKSRYQDINSKKSLDYLEYLFKTTSLSNSSNWQDIIRFFENTPLMSSTNDKEFVVSFHVLFMFFKKLAISYEYQDLNIRHLKLSDIFVFEHESVKLDLIFEYLFKPKKEDLMEVSILEGDNYRFFLESNQLNLGDIYDFLDIKPSTLTELIAFDHPEVESIGLKNFAFKKREERLTKLVKEVFTKQNIITLFESIYPRNERQIRKLIKEWYSEYDASIPALFEFLLSISFYWISDGKLSLSDILGMRLDSNLLPKSHAPGGRADIVIKSFSIHYLIEATLSENDGQRQMEAEPVPRHLANHIKQYKNETICLFVAGKLDPNNIVVLRSYKILPWYYNSGNNKIDSMNIIPLTIENFLYILREDIKLEEFESKLKKLLGSNSINGKEWYENEINIEFNYAK